MLDLIITITASQIKNYFRNTSQGIYDEKI